NTLGFAYEQLGRFDDAQQALQRAAERKIEFAGLGLLQYDLAFLAGDAAKMKEHAAAVRAGAGGADWMSNHEAFVLAYAGRLREAVAKSREASDLAQQAGRPERAALFGTASALWAAFFGNARDARQAAGAALALSNDRDVEYGAGLALAI